MKPDRNYYIGRNLAPGFQVQRFIGAGAFAWVYLATGARNEEVAIKIQYNLADDARKRFTREIKVLQQLPQNDYLIRYVADGTTPEGLPYLVMEYVDGATLKESLKYKPTWPPQEAANFMIQLCDAFGGLHELGLAHRDVKPDNIMLTRDWRVKLMDLGLVKDAQGLLHLFETEDILEGRDFGENLDKGVLAGTPEYMAPEQFSDPSLEDDSKAQTDTMTDVYSLGLIFYEMIAGQKLFAFNANTKSQGDYARSLLDYLKVRTNQRDESLRPPNGVDDALWSIMMRALRADPKLRQRNAPELGADIRRYLETGQGIVIQDEEKTSAIDLNDFLALHGGLPSEPSPAPQNKPRNPKTLPLPPVGDIPAKPKPHQQVRPQQAQHPQHPQHQGRLQQPNPYGRNSGPYSGGSSNPYMQGYGPQQGGGGNMLLWIVLVVFAVAVFGGGVAIFVFAR